MKSSDRWLLPDGVEELLPAQAAGAERLRRKLLDLYSSWGYELIIPPLLEYTDSLLVGLGSDIDLLTFRVTDQLTGRMMGLRADITPQAARIDAHSLRREGVVRLCYAGSVLHTRPKEPLASRSPIQLGAELYGDNSPASDLEIICLMLETLRVAGVRQITLDLGHVGVYRALVSAVGLEGDDESRFFDLLQRKAAVELDAFVTALGLNSDDAAMLRGLSELHGNESVLARGRELFASVPEALAAVDALSRLAAQLRKRMPEVAYYFDLAELRGYHYHTGLVFSALAADCNQALASGGRYDDIGEVFGRARPATGFSIDLKALLAIQPEMSLAGGILAPDEDDVALWQCISELRAAGERVITVFPDSGPVQGCDRQLCLRDGQWVIVDL